MARKKKGAPEPTIGKVWHLAKVHRADAGGTLLNAVNIDSGREYFGVPSYDRDAMQRRVDTLNRDGVNVTRSKAADPWAVLDRIAREIDGQETDSGTMSNVIEHLTDAGYDLRDPADLEDTDG